MSRPPLHLQSRRVFFKSLNKHSLRIILALIVCCSLLFSSLGQARSSASTSAEPQVIGLQKGSGWTGSMRQVFASLLAIFQGGGPPDVPGPNLPNLNDARLEEPTEPVAPDPIESTLACTDCRPCVNCGPGDSNHAPVVSAAGPYTGTAGTEINFNGLRSFDLDPGDGISDYAWNFGDGSAVSHDASPNHTYQSSGTYNVSLTVTDRHNTTSNATTSATVAAAVASPSPSPGGQGNGAAFISQSLPTTMTAGQRYPVSVTMRNTGSSTWTAARLYRLGSQNPQDNGNWGTSRVYLPSSVAPGADVTINFTVVAPCNGCEAPPATHFKWRMVQDGVEWFGEESADQTVTIVSNYQPPNGIPVEAVKFRDLFNSRIAVEHRTGQPGDDLLSRNFNWGLSLLDLAGRAGLNLNIPLSYNSQAVWTKTVQMPTFGDPSASPLTAFTFDADRGSPAPGFRLGFPTVVGPYENAQTLTGAYLMVTPSGAHVELRRVGSSNIYETVDSSYLQLIDGENGSLLVRGPDGSQWAYWAINGAYRCTEIKDRNGNYITIKYDPINEVANLGRVTSVIDTLGRIINFNYDSHYHLQTITQTRNGEAHVWASFGYTDMYISTRFVVEDEENEEPMEVQGSQQEGVPVALLTQIGLDDGSSYNFDYTTWGQIYKITRKAADGHPLSSTTYNLPIDNELPQTDCPGFTETQDWAENWNNDEPVITSYQSGIDGNGRYDEATYAAGTPIQISSREYSPTDYQDWLRGLVTRTETRDATYTLKKTTTTVWARDQSGLPYALNPRPKRIAIFDSDGNRRQTSFEYTSFGLLSEVFEQGPLNTVDWSILRRTHIDYDLSPAYVNRHIYGLLQGQYLFAPDGSNTPSVQTLMNKTTYEYDVDTAICNDEPCLAYATAANSSSIVQHDGLNYGSNFTVGRGAMTKAHRWDVGDESNNGNTRITSRAHYDSLGSLIRSSDPLGHKTTIGYTDQFSVDGINVTNPAQPTLAYPTIVTNPEGYAASSQYNYSLGTRTRTQDPKGAAVITEYDSAGRVKKIANNFNETGSRMIYPSSQTIQVSATTVNDDNPENDPETFSFTVYDGAGRVRASAKDFPDSTPHYAGQYTTFDVLGRTVKKFSPVEINVDWTVTGADAIGQGGFGWIFSAQSYDWNGRPLITTNTDNTTTTATYGGCGCAGGEVVTLTDAGAIDPVTHTLKRRQRRISHDVLGRPWKTETLNWQGGTAYSSIVNNYNVRDQVISVRKFEGSGVIDPGDQTCSNGLNANGGGPICQLTSQSYDGHGRLQSKHDPIQSSGTATTFTYNGDDQVNTMTDARGVTATFQYDGRHLINSVSYPPAQYLPANVLPTSTISFTYDAAGNRASMSDGSGSIDYAYDLLSRPTLETHHITGLSASYPITYGYDDAGNMISLGYPGGNTVTYGYDSTGRTKTVNGPSQNGISQYVSNIEYRAFGAYRSVSYGNSKVLSLDYNERMQLQKYRIKHLYQNVWYDDVHVENTYYPSGEPKYARDFVNPAFNRAAFYDQAGRIHDAYSGGDADYYVGEPVHSNISPYKQSKDYAPSDDLASLTTRYWHRWNTLNTTYINGRNQDPVWQYDANGSIRFDNDYEHKYDASGIGRYMRGLVAGSIPIETVIDGDGNVVKQTNMGPTQYYLRSTVLGGSVLAEYGSNAAWTKIRYYLDGELLATQEWGNFNWEHRNPITGSHGKSRWDGSNGQYEQYVEPDSDGLNVGFSDPDDYVLPPPQEPDIATIYPGPLGGCRVEGIKVDCAFAMQLLTGNTAVRCPSDDCDAQPRWGIDEDGKVKQIGWFIPTGEGGWASNGKYGVWITEDGVSYDDDEDYDLGMMMYRGSSKERKKKKRNPFKRSLPQNPPTPQNPREPQGTFDDAYQNCITSLAQSMVPGLAQAADILDVANKTGVDPTLLAVTWRFESGFSFQPRNGMHTPSTQTGDVGPGQLFPDTWNKSPYTDKLKNPFGTNLNRGELFNGNAYESLIVTGRALGKARGSDRAHAAGLYRAGSNTNPGYNERVKNFNDNGRNYDAFFSCLARKGFSP